MFLATADAPTKPLFGRCLYYGIGTTLLMAALTMMVSILGVVTRVASAFRATALTGALLVRTSRKT